MDKFTRLDKLGKGSFGDVWLVERKEDKRVNSIFMNKEIESDCFII